MLTETLRSQIDKLWDAFWADGITNPLTIIEQISFLMFARLLEAHPPRLKNLDGNDMLKVVRDEVFPHLKAIGGNYMTDAQLMIDNPRLLVFAINLIDKLPLTNGEKSGNIYEYLLSKLTTAGINDQFRTPRHIIRLMVEMLEPQPHEIVGDPACGTAGFLVSVKQYLWEKYTDSNSMNGEHCMPHGFDFDSTMLRLAVMNLMLHGLKTPNIHYQDMLSKTLFDNFPEFSNNFRAQLEKFEQQGEQLFHALTQKGDI